MYKIGLSTFGKEIGKELFEKYHAAGIDAMEFCTDPEKYDSLNFGDIKKWADETDTLLWSFHFPFSPFDKIDISNESTCEGTISYFEELIKKAAAIGIKIFVIHPSGEPIEENDRPKRMKCAKESLFTLAEIAKKYDAVIAVEDLPRTCLGKDSDEISELIGVHENLRICFDVNHLLSENPVDFIHKLGDKIITVHISDYDFVNERHWLPGEGKLDWQAILQAFKDIGYNGVWLYEIGFACPKTIIRNRDLTCEDFARNAHELFENKEITIFSKHKENLGMWE